MALLRVSAWFDVAGRCDRAVQPLSVSGSLNPERIDGHGREIALAVDPPYQRARLKGRRARRQPDPSSRQAVAAT